MHNIFYEAMKNVSDIEFLELLCRAEHEPIINGVTMPSFPDKGIQEMFVGSSGGATLRGEGWLFYNMIKESTCKFKNPITSNTKILDFGCGWGRMIRFFFKDVVEENIYGVDVNPYMIQVCKETLGLGNYEVTPSAPPTEFNNDTFDIIFAYSVFSHLNERLTTQWVKEFSRILRPNGILIATTHGEPFLSFVKDLQSGTVAAATAWHEGIRDIFTPVNEFIERYNNGEFIFADTYASERKDSEDNGYAEYGDTLISEAYARNELGKYLLYRDFIPAGAQLPQSTFILQKDEK